MNCGVSLGRGDSVQETTSVMERNSLIAGHGNPRIAVDGHACIAVDRHPRMAAHLLVAPEPFADVLDAVVVGHSSVIAVEVVEVDSLSLSGFVG